MNSLTNEGERVALYAGGIATVATTLRLYTTASVPSKAGDAFVEPDEDNGYEPIDVTIADWTFSVVGGVGRVTLDDQSWAAVGGTIPDVAGAFIADADGDPLAWWEMTPGTVFEGGVVDVSNKYIG